MKKWGCWCWVTNRSGWLLELLTELKMAIILPTGQWYAPSAVHSFILCYTLLYSIHATNV